MRLTATLETKHYAVGEVISLAFRHPTTQELADYNRGQYVLDGRQVVNRVPEARLALADKILIGVSGLEVTLADGNTVPVGPSLELLDDDRSAWGQALGMDVKSWRDLVPTALKMDAILHLEMNGWSTPNPSKEAVPEAAAAVPSISASGSI